jgi:predicted transcriptional regulator of viral defense system
MNELSDAQKKIVETVTPSINAYGKPVLMKNELRSIYRDQIPGRTSHRKIEEALKRSGVIAARTIKSENYKDVERIVVPALNPTPYHFALSIRGDTYLSHGSAVYLAGLTQQQPKTVYVNKEQSPKPSSQGSMVQEAIDRAFARPQRRSNYTFRIDGFQIVLISGKATNNAGVILDPEWRIPTTCLERTLIDIAVRPRYAGGVFQVMEAYQNGIEEIDVDQLIALLDSLDYRYPYHQSIGFYLENAGADETVLHRLRSRGLQFDFYLDYAMANPRYDQSWRVWVPLGI